MSVHDHLLQNISGVKEYSTSLIKLSERWDLLTLLGQMSNIGMDMSCTKAEFQQLTDELMHKLTEETVNKNTEEFAAIAQVAVDIVIRNLFERTADIGFLATDDDIRDYVQFLQKNAFDTDESREERRERKESMVQRFKDYVAKYSVYSDIILLDLNGNVLAQLDSENPIKTSSDPLLQEAANTSAEYVEVYRRSDLSPNKEQSLIYAYRVTKSNEPGSELLGVLCLVFRFENEMQGIFNNLKDDNDWFDIMLLDRDGRVIASSDNYHIPIGAAMEMELEKPYRIVRFGGREYVSKTCATSGYQGFFGLGWYGHVMAPLDHAFADAVNPNYSVDDEVLESVMKTSSLFPEELRTIPQKAERIQKELNTTVWNGNVQIANTKSGDNSFSKSLLNEISKTGSDTKEIFEDSIANLNTTVVGSMLSNVQFQAALAIDIMDRNLYERANDCRWWALTTYFRQSMELAELLPDHQNQISSILSYINNLYTVYTNLIVYDASGTILAVSNQSEQRIVGQKISAGWVQETLSINSPQSYSVSAFEKSEYYKGRPTYIYGAPIFGLKNPQKAVGGIAIVFDSEPQFQAMLADALPKGSDGNVLTGCYALFTDRSKTILASSSNDFKVGHTINIDEEFFSLPNGQGRSTILEYEGHYYVAGSTTSQGYREYKVNDGYVQDVIALVLIHIGQVQKDDHKEIAKKRECAYPVPQGSEEAIEVSTFLINNRLYGVESSLVVCSVTGQEITPILGCDERYLGVITMLGRTVPVVSLKNMVQGLEGYDQSYDSENDVIIIVKYKGVELGLVGDSIHDSPSIPVRCIEACSGFGNSTITGAIVRPESGEERKEMLSILNVSAISHTILGNKKQQLETDRPVVLEHQV